MSTHRRTDYTGREAIDRHRLYGPDLYAIDIDLLEVGLDREPQAVIEYKHFQANEISDFQREVIRRLAGDTPAFTVRYWPASWTYVVTALNDAARKVIGDGRELMTERDYADFLHGLRDHKTTEPDYDLHETIDERAKRYFNRRREDDRPPIRKQTSRAPADTPANRDRRT